MGMKRNGNRNRRTWWTAHVFILPLTTQPLTTQPLFPPYIQNGSEPFWKVFELYNIHDWRLSGTYWPAVAWQVPKMIALFFVVAFGSSMDVAAIQQDMPEPLDFDKELITVGKELVTVCNVVLLHLCCCVCNDVLWYLYG